jgi:hypothetical protein
MIAFVTPWIFSIGPLSLPAPRLFLLVITLPCLIKWIRGGAGRIRVADFAILLFCLWGAVSLAVVHGVNFAVQPAGSLFVETMGAYLLARCYIRSADDFLNMARALFKVVLFLLPFALFETVTGRDILLELFSAVMKSYAYTGGDRRGGFYRVQAVFDHSILFGLCTGSAFALTHLVIGRGMPAPQRLWRTMIVGLTAVLSLSSAPIAALAMQATFMMWDWLLRSIRYRWAILWAFAFAAYIAVELGSNQSAVKFYISHLTFDPHTGWHRLLIWEYGSATVWQHPLFGIGFGEWARESWMGDSVDMFWLLNAMRFGLPAGLLIFSAFLMLVVSVGMKKGLGERLSAYRTAYLIVMTSFLVVGWTVHFWSMAYIWFLFLLGSGVWLLDVKTHEKCRVAAVQPRPRPGRKCDDRGAV